MTIAHNGHQKKCETWTEKTCKRTIVLIQMLRIL